MSKPRFLPHLPKFLFTVVVLAAGARTAGAADPDDVFWSANTSFQGPQGLIDELVVVGDDVYATGRFKTVGGRPIHHIARWDGSQWNEIGGGVGTPTMGLIHRVLVDGNRVYPAGMFGVVGGNVPAMNIAMWDGSAWDTMAGGTDRAVRALARAPGGDVYVGGEFTTAGGVMARGIARWDGVQWHALGSGINNHVAAVAVKGNNVFVGGAFTTAGGRPASFIARWDGSQWQPLGAGVNNLVTAIASDGQDVYVGGLFSTAGGVAVHSIARWDGSRWWALGAGVSGPAPAVRAIYPDNGGLYVGGFFRFAGGRPANYAAHWDGAAWSALGSGTSFSVKAFARHNDIIYVGGEFLSVGDGVTSNYLAEWTRSPAVPVFFDRFTATPVAAAVELAWDIRYDEPIAGYNIYRSQTAGTAPRRINPGGLIGEQTRSHTDRDVRGGAEYEYVLAAVRPDGSEMRSAPTRVRTMPIAVGLRQNHPNPFNPSTVIEFTLAAAGPVTLSVYDARGRRMATLVNGRRAEGVNRVTWDGRSDSGRALASGVYFYRLRSDAVSLTRKMILMK
ncbi:MAG: FlgD immunoglobulin-like domain containing protein [Candidatus Krumholzibacteriia bacterium]